MKHFNPPFRKAANWAWRIKKAGLKQAEFAARADVQVPLTNLNRWSRLEHNPPRDAALRIEAALKALKV